jgi:hypothetical protein
MQWMLSNRTKLLAVYSSNDVLEASIRVTKEKCSSFGDRRDSLI